MAAKKTPNSKNSKNSKGKTAKTHAQSNGDFESHDDESDDDDVPVELTGEAEQFDDSDYEDQSSDLDGFADPKAGKVHLRVLRARTFDNKTEPSKPSILLIAELLTRRGLQRDRELVQGEVGHTIGVWYKPGMRKALDHAGVPMTIECTGSIDTGKPHPMFTYAVKTKGEGTLVPLEADYRKDSKGAKLPLEDWTNAANRENRKARQGADPQGEQDDDIPFS
jgi:hypothetical protein